MQKVPLAMRVSADHKAIHFGCWYQSGHFFHDTEGRSLGLSASDLRLPWEFVDGRLTPRSGGQGRAALHRKGGWTALAVHDFTVDSRPGSNTVFFFHAELDPDEALFSVIEHFPSIERRIGEITIVEVHDDGRGEGDCS